MTRVLGEDLHCSLAAKVFLVPRPDSGWWWLQLAAAGLASPLKVVTEAVGLKGLQTARLAHLTEPFTFPPL